MQLDAALAIGPGRADAVRVLALWQMRRSAWFLLFAGIAIGGILTDLAGRSQVVTIDTTFRTLPTQLFSFYGLAIFAIVFRLAVSWLYLLATVYVIKDREVDIDKRTGVVGFFSTWRDRWYFAKTIAAARLTYRVRMAAVARLAGLRTPYLWVNRGVTALNVLTGVAALLVLILFDVSIQVTDVPRSPI